MVRSEEVWQVLTYRFLDGRALIFATIAMPGSTSRGSGPVMDFYDDVRTIVGLTEMPSDI